MNRYYIKLFSKYPFQDVDQRTVEKKGYDYFKLPIGRNLFRRQSLDGPRAKNELRKFCLEKLYELYENFRKKYEKNNFFVKPIIFIVLPEFSNSQVLIFFNREIFRTWFIRQTSELMWIKKYKKNPLLTKNHLSVYKYLKETHFLEKAIDKTFHPPFETKRDLWFYE